MSQASTPHWAQEPSSPPDGPPAYALQDVPEPWKLPKDDLGRDIAFLIARHPEIVASLGEIDLDTTDIPSKVDLLMRIKGLLGIKPTRRRDLGYVGPAAPQ